MKDISNILVGPDSCIRDAMLAIDGAPRKGLPSGICCVANEDRRLLGVVTDGNIRRALMSGIDLDEKLSEVMVTEPVTVSDKLSSQEMVRSMFRQVEGAKHIRARKVDSVIVVDDDGRVVDVVDFVELLMESEVHYKSVSIIGMGYVGLTLGLTLAEAGFQTYGIESDERVASLLSNGQPHFHEIGLASLLRHQVRRGTFSIADSMDRIAADVYIIAVGTPLDAERNPDMSFIENAAQAVGERLKAGDLVVLRSTVPVGTTNNVVIPILEESSGLRSGAEFSVAFAPERTIEGKALEECRTLPQVIGGLDKRSEDSAAKLFGKVTRTIVRVDSLEAAEMVKLVNNCFRDLCFAFSNELAVLCDRIGINSNDVIGAANEGYPRDRVPQPSPGVGGACLTKDPYIYSSVAEKLGCGDTLSRAGRGVNERMISHVVSKVLRFLDDNDLGYDCKIFMMGFAFKGDPETSDTRNSTTVEVFQKLGGTCTNITGYDPVVGAEDLLSLGIRYEGVVAGSTGAHVTMIMNNHKSFRNLPIADIVGNMAKPGYLFDPWQLFAKEDILQEEGISYSGLSL